MLPHPVRMDSGWNWTAAIGSSVCSIAMMMPENKIIFGVITSDHTHQAAFETHGY